jgi:LuxR family maltose regulon positive regulatory protein
MELIRTLLRPPTNGPGLIERAKLDRVAERILQYRIVFAKAPAGYGKSSLMQRWYSALIATGAVAGWLSLDEDPADLRSFVAYAAAAIRQSAPNFGSDLLEFLNSARNPTPTRVAAAFLNALAAFPAHLILFIDDFHLLSDKSAIRAIEIVLRDAPKNFHVVVAGRQSLPISLARLRMLREVYEVDVDDLRFTLDELNEFARLFGYGPFAAAESERLLNATEGWAAGIQLALISMRQHEDVGHFLERFSGENRIVTEFLVDDVIENLSDETVEFLLRTSVLESFNRDLCNEIAGTAHAERFIAELTTRSLFIFSLDDENDWYRYHHLFADVLQRMLRERHPTLAPELHRKAARWFARSGRAELAFSHSVRASDFKLAAEILDEACTGIFYQGKLGTLTRLAGQIPQETLNEVPRLQLELAWSIILEWRFDEAGEILRRVDAVLERWRASDVDPGIIEEVARIVAHRRMMLALFMDDAVALERSVLDLLHDFPTNDPYLRGTLENCLIYARREMFRLDQVDRMDRVGREFFERSGSKFVLVWHESILGPTFHMRGDTALAERSLQSAIDIAAYVSGPKTPLQAMPAMLLAEILYESNEIARAQELIASLGSLTERLGFVDNLCAYFVVKCRLARRRGALEDARAIIAEGEACAEHRGFGRLRRRLWLERIRLAVEVGDIGYLRAELAAAEHPLQKARLLPGQNTIGRDEYFALGWAMAAIHTGQARAAIDALRRWTAFTGGRKALRSEVRFLIALASALALAGERGEALRKLRQAVQKAAAPRFVGSFLDGGGPVLGLLQELFDLREDSADPAAAFGNALLRAFGESPPEQESGSAARRAAPQDGYAPPEPLNEREREVLRLAASGRANKHIARTLGMTEGTVKWYMQQVFSKLDVRRRSLAVQRAREFDLL